MEGSPLQAFSLRFRVRLGFALYNRDLYLLVCVLYQAETFACSPQEPRVYSNVSFPRHLQALLGSAVLKFKVWIQEDTARTLASPVV